MLDNFPFKIICWTLNSPWKGCQETLHELGYHVQNHPLHIWYLPVSSKEEADQNIVQKYHDLQKVITLMYQFAKTQPLCVRLFVFGFVFLILLLRSIPSTNSQNKNFICCLINWVYLRCCQGLALLKWLTCNPIVRCQYAQSHHTWTSNASVWLQRMRFLWIFSLVSLLFVDSIDVVGGRQQQVNN